MPMLKNTLLLISIILVSLAIVFSAYIVKDRDICCGIALCRNMANICDEQEESENTVLTSSKGTELTLLNIQSNDTISNGIDINGHVKGNWYFEGEFPVRILDSRGDVVASTSAIAQSEWTTDEEVPFKLRVDLPIIQEHNLVFVFLKSNPSGLMENDDSVSIPLTVLGNNEQTVVNIYFPNVEQGSADDCSKVFPVTRTIPEVTAIARVTLEQLFLGPTISEEERGYFSNISDDVRIQSLSIANGVARVDLSSELEEGVGGSCTVTSIRAQIEETLKQFPTVDEVILSIDGRTEDILQP